MTPTRTPRNKLAGLILLFGLSLFLQDCRGDGPRPVPDDPHQPHDFIARNGMVVAAHPLAAEAGREVLQRGGNAVDAAVATALALNAAEPFASGIGGGGFMIIHLAENKRTVVVNFRETAPAAAAPDMYLENGEVRDEWRRDHGKAVAVPGAPAGWSHALRSYGTMPLKDVIQGAIRIAEQGFLVTETFSKINKDEYEKILRNAGEDSVYLNQGFPYEPGDMFRNPELAAFFRFLAEKGLDEFYRGETAKKIVAAVRVKGGDMSLKDLAAYRPIETAPLQGKYKDTTLFTIPPPSCGGAHMVQLLNIIEHWPVREWGRNSTAYIHHLSEAFRFVFADRARWMGDPAFVRVPIEHLTGKEYAARIAASIKADRPAGDYPAGGFDPPDMEQENTTHLCVIDPEGNIVALTQSINLFFGTGIVPEGTGFILNNHMRDFSPDPDSPNAPEPGKRPVSNMGPLILFRGGRALLALGSPGGTRIFPSLTQIILNLIEFDLGLDEAIEAARFFSYSAQGRARAISLENRIPEDIRAALEKMGHLLNIREAHDNYFGGAQGILIPSDGRRIHGGADSRRDGFGAGY